MHVTTSYARVHAQHTPTSHIRTHTHTAYFATYSDSLLDAALQLWPRRLRVVDRLPCSPLEVVSEPIALADLSLQPRDAADDGGSHLVVPVDGSGWRGRGEDPTQPGPLNASAHARASLAVGGLDAGQVDGRPKEEVVPLRRQSADGGHKHVAGDEGGQRADPLPEEVTDERRTEELVRVEREGEGLVPAEAREGDLRATEGGVGSTARPPPPPRTGGRRDCGVDARGQPHEVGVLAPEEAILLPLALEDLPAGRAAGEPAPPLRGRAALVLPGHLASSAREEEHALPSGERLPQARGEVGTGRAAGSASSRRRAAYKPRAETFVAPKRSKVAAVPGSG